MRIPDSYKIIHQDAKTEQYLVLNEITNEVCLLKILKTYDIEVYKQLKAIKSVHIPKIYEFIEDNEELLVIEEYINGDTLEDLLLKNSLDANKKKQILLELCDSLDVLHKAPFKIIHRDLKATNIMLTKEGVIKLIDYDAAKIYRDGNSKDTVLLGTPSVAAPEQYGFSQSDVRTDVFAMGKLIARMFPDDAYFRKVATRATRLDPVDRYQTILELKSAIEGKSSGSFWQRLLVPPGFRHGNVWHMLIASIYYALAIYVIVGVVFRNDNADRWPIGRFLWFFIQTVIVWFSIVDIEFRWTGIWDKVPFVKSKDTTTHVVAGILIWFLIVLISRLANSYLVDILFPYIY